MAPSRKINRRKTMKKKPMKRGKKIVKKSRKTYKKKGGIDSGLKEAIEFNNKGFKITIQRAFGTEEESIFNDVGDKFADTKNNKTEVININPEKKKNYIVQHFSSPSIIEDIRKFQIKHKPDGEEVKLDDINKFIKEYPYYMKKNKFGIGEFHKVLNIKHFNTKSKNPEKYIIEIPKA